MASKGAVRKNAVSTPDVWGNFVRCSIDHWEEHIVDPLDGHPELTGREKEVEQAILDPDLIRPSTATGRAFAFERRGTADEIRVVVSYQEPDLIRQGGTSGWVSTAYPIDYAYSSQVGVPIYRKSATKGAALSQTEEEKKP